MFVKKVTKLIEKVKIPTVKIINKLSNTKLRIVINITKENFNKLLAGESVSDYDAYKKDAWYNIVSEPTTFKVKIEAVKETSEKIKQVFDATVLNNVDGSLPHNEETESTFTNTNTPQLALRYFNPVVKPHKDMQIWYFVDTKFGNFLYRNTISDTFTTTIKNANGDILYKNTTYAGEFSVPINFGNITGETWFSIQTVDNHGVASAMQFFDVLIQDIEPKNVYEVKATDLENYTLVPNDTNALVAYKNKKGFSDLFKWAKNHGYDGIKLYNPDNRTYYIDYHKNISSTTGVIDLGTTRYYLYKIEGGELIGNPIELTPNKQFSINGNSYKVGSNVRDWILEDGAELYRDDKGKILVKWKGAWLDSNTQVYSTGRFLRTYRYSALTKTIEETVDGQTIQYPAYSKFEDGYYYVVNSTVPYLSGKGATGGDPIIFPDNFTVDLNGITIQAIPCYNIRLGASVVFFNDNFNSHVKNGKLVGMYQHYNFPNNVIESGLDRDSVPVEHVSVVAIQGSRYCSVEDVEVSYSTGYEGTVGSLETSAQVSYDSTSNLKKFDPNNSYTCTYPVVRFNKPGYIGYDGSEVALGSIQPLVYNSSDKAYGDSIGLTYTNNLIPCNPYYKNKNGVNTPTYEISIEPGGYKQYMSGKYHEVFVHFYDENRNFISTVKTQMYMLIKIPKNTKYVRITGYGVFKNNMPALDSYGRNVAFQHIVMHARGTFSKNTWYTNCFWHDTRTIGLSMSYAKGHTWRNCNFTRIAIEPKPDWHVTKIFADFEEGWESTDGPSILNCTAERGYSTETNDQGQRVIAINCYRNATFMDNVGIGVEERGGIESALYYRSNIPVLRIEKTGTYEKPMSRYEDLDVDTELKMTYRDDSISRIYSSYNSRYNRCDDSVINIFKLSDITTVLPTYSGQTTMIETDLSNYTAVPKQTPKKTKTE